ncbi:MAG: hypothetical protein KC729_17235, partial [Candidatus Eisenbacteria bacterium]|nr:hypothetical protein [Candidatus Eisenbacteria bacterium]
MRFVEIVCCLVLVGWPVSDTAVQAQSPGAAEPDARSRVGTPVPDAASRCDRALSVAVADSATTLPISQVAVRLHPLGRETGSASGADPRHRDEPAVGASPRTRTAFTDPNGIARFADLCPGSYEIETIHVGYLPHRATVSIPRAPENSPGTDGAASLRLALTSRVYAMEEVDVRAETVAPLVSLERSSHLLPSEPVKPFVSYGLADAIALVPGVLVSGERIFFRGVATEHVATTIDGVPARDPITGDWILPPPQAVAGAELIASTVVET